MAEHGRTTTVATQLLTITDLADLLRVSRGTVYELIRRGDLVPIRVGQRFRFTTQEIDGYLARRHEEQPGRQELDSSSSYRNESSVKTP